MLNMEYLKEVEGKSVHDYVEVKKKYKVRNLIIKDKCSHMIDKITSN